MPAGAERGIQWVPNQRIVELDPQTKVARTTDGTELPFDLFLGVPKHVVPPVVAESGLCVDGWVPVDSLTLATAFPGVYAVGDVTSVGTPKAGVFAEGQADIVADAIIAEVRGEESTSTYDGTGICFMEFGNDEVGKVEVTFLRGEAPRDSFVAPSESVANDRSDSGSERVRRWFGRDSTPT